MSEKVAVIASILKPVDDTRLYEKLGISISETKKYRVNIIGFEAKNPPHHAGIDFHVIYSGRRLGLTRFLVPWKFMVKLITLTPSLTIVCTPELLIPAVLYKVFFGTRLWYDVQENYQKNVQYQSAYPPVLKPLLKLAVNIIEKASGPFVDQYLLAEKGYLKELKFINGKSTVLENKFRSLNISVKADSSDKPVKFVFTGTCSKENGIVEAVSLVEALLLQHYPVQLDIIGHFPDPKQLWSIQGLTKKYKGKINLKGHRSPVPHSLIMQYAAQANYGLVAHQPNPSTENCIPTKIYEYLGLRLPMILQEHQLWESVTMPYQAALAIDYKDVDATNLWYRLHTTEFYVNAPGAEITWEQEAQKLLAQL